MAIGLGSNNSNKYKQIAQHMLFYNPKLVLCITINVNLLVIICRIVTYPSAKNRDKTYRGEEKNLSKDTSQRQARPRHHFATTES